MGLIVPALSPTRSGRVVEYLPSLNEPWSDSLGIPGRWAPCSTPGCLRGRARSRGGSAPHLHPRARPPPGPSRSGRPKPGSIPPCSVSPTGLLGFARPPVSPSGDVARQSKDPAREMSPEEAAAICQQWGACQTLPRSNVGCYECHMALPTRPDDLRGITGRRVTNDRRAGDCGLLRRWAGERVQLSSARQGAAHPRRSLDSVPRRGGGGQSRVPDRCSQGVSGRRRRTPGCWRCHGAKVKLMPNHKQPDWPAGWPDTGIRPHQLRRRRGAPAAMSRPARSSPPPWIPAPRTPRQNSHGPGPPQQVEIWRSPSTRASPTASVSKMALDNPKWVVGGHWRRADLRHLPHGAAKRRRHSHAVGLRRQPASQWPVSIPARGRRRQARAAAGGTFPGPRWRTGSGRNVCLACHNADFVGSFCMRVRQRSWVVPGQVR